MPSSVSRCPRWSNGRQGLPQVSEPGTAYERLCRHPGPARGKVYHGRVHLYYDRVASMGARVTSAPQKTHTAPVRTRRRPTRRRWAPAYLRTAAWQAKRQAVWERAKGMCEFCQRRPLRHVHHRTYAAFGREPLRDLLAVCAGCHRYIHHRGPRGTCTAGSLMAQGDRGLGTSAIWRRYLATTPKGGAHERAPIRPVRRSA
jgi:hypothetical protein